MGATGAVAAVAAARVARLRAAVVTVSVGPEVTMFVVMGEVASALPYARGSAVTGLKPPRSWRTAFGAAAGR